MEMFYRKMCIIFITIITIQILKHFYMPLLFGTEYVITAKN